MLTILKNNKYKVAFFKKHKGDFIFKDAVFSIFNGTPVSHILNGHHIEYKNESEGKKWLTYSKNGYYYVSRYQFKTKENYIFDLSYNKNGRLENNGLYPALSVWNEDGKLTREQYFLDGIDHNDNGPAIKIFDKHGSLYKLMFLNHGQLHRIGGPAIIEYDIYNNIMFEAYYVDGKPHRLDGPAIIERNINKIVSNEIYYNKGKKQIVNSLK